MILKLLNFNMLLEKQMAEIFSIVSENFRSQPELNSFWKKLISEETKHYNQLALELTFVKSKPDSYVSCDINLNPVMKMNTIMKSVSHALLDPFLDQEKICTALRDLETLLQQIHEDLEAQVEDKKLQVLFRSLAQGDRSLLEEIESMFHLGSRMEEKMQKAA